MKVQDGLLFTAATDYQKDTREQNYSLYYVGKEALLSEGSLVCVTYTEGLMLPVAQYPLNSWRNIAEHFLTQEVLYPTQNSLLHLTLMDKKEKKKKPKS